MPPPRPVPLARPVLPVPAEISEGAPVPAGISEGTLREEGARQLLEDDGQEQWMDGALAAAELDKAGQ